MFAGKLVAHDEATAIYNTPQHDYTKKLWASFPSRRFRRPSGAYHLVFAACRTRWRLSVIRQRQDDLRPDGRWANVSRRQARSYKGRGRI